MCVCVCGWLFWPRFEMASFIKRNGTRDANAGGVEIARNSSNHWPWKWALNGSGSRGISFPRLIYKTQETDSFFRHDVSFKKRILEKAKESLLNNFYFFFFF